MIDDDGSATATEMPRSKEIYMLMPIRTNTAKVVLAWQVPGEILFLTTRMIPRANTVLKRRAPAVGRRRILFSTSRSKQQQSSAAAAKVVASPVQQPTDRQLRLVALHASIPMVGFGLMDNWLMIQFGDAFDNSLGIVLGLSTLAAAGIGNTVSDIAGVWFGDVVEATAAKLNLPEHGLTKVQRNLKRTRMYHAIGGSVGIVLGCVLGMSCLLFMDTDRADKAKKAKELQSIFESIMYEGHDLVHADRATLWMYDADKNLAWSRVATGTKGIITVPADSGFVGACIQSGETINISHAYGDARFNKAVDQSTGYHTKRVLVMPVRDRNGNIIGAIQMINKKDPNTGGDTAFTQEDEKIVHLLATHVETFIRTVMGSSSNASEICMACMA